LKQYRISNVSKIQRIKKSTGTSAHQYQKRIKNTLCRIKTYQKKLYRMFCDKREPITTAANNIIENALHERPCCCSLVWLLLLLLLLTD
jgi:hypothetical protein